jgi:hypothetical protein
MRKFLAIGLVFVMVFGVSAVALAGDVQHDLVDNSSVSVQEISVIYTGDPVTITAVTPKNGSYVKSEGFISEGATVDSNNDRTLTTVNGVNVYTTTAIFTAATAGNYTVTYTLIMGAGKSDVTFVSTGTSESFSVIDKTPVLIGIDFQQVSKTSVGINWQVKGYVIYNYAGGTSVTSTTLDTFVYKKGASFDIVRDGFTYTLN